MNFWIAIIAVVTGVAAFAFGATYLFALGGEPQSVWIMRDIFHVLPQPPSIAWTTTNNDFVFKNPPPMAFISNSGDVTINWAETEKVAADHQNPNWAYACLMISIRDHTWKPDY